MRLSQPHDLAWLLRESLTSAAAENPASPDLAAGGGPPSSPVSHSGEIRRRADQEAFNDHGGRTAARPRVFIAYVMEDAALADRLYNELESIGFDPWMDRRSLLPGEHWLRSIERGIETSRFFIACLSSRSVDKRSRFQAELRYALDCAQLMPAGDIFFIPVRFDECRVPWTIARSIQYVDLFPDWDRGLRRILKMACEQLLADLPPDNEG